MSKRRGTSFHGGTVQTGGQPNFPGTSVAQPMPEGPRPMTPGPGVIGAEVTVGGSTPGVEVTKDVAYYEDQKTGMQIPRGDISNFTSGRAPYSGRVSMKEMHNGQPRIKAHYDKTVHAEQPLGGYADKGDILQPASESMTVRAEDMPAGGVTKHPGAQAFIEEHGSTQQSEYAKAPPAEQKDILKDPNKFDNRVRGRIK